MGKNDIIKAAATIVAVIGVGAGGYVAVQPGEPFVLHDVTSANLVQKIVEEIDKRPLPRGSVTIDGKEIDPETYRSLRGSLVKKGREGDVLDLEDQDALTRIFNYESKEKQKSMLERTIDRLTD